MSDQLKHPLIQKITVRRELLSSKDALRCRSVYPDNKVLGQRAEPNSVNFASNDYLGLSQEAELIRALCLGAHQHGLGSGASPLVTGYQSVHKQLEDKLCELTGHESALLFCSGFSANSALIDTLFCKGDLVLGDKLIHASVIDGFGRSEAKLIRFRHNDLDGLERLLQCHQVVAIVVESIYSMEGDLAPLVELSRLCQQYQAWLIVDDAHGFGTLGEGGFGASCLAQEIHIDAQLVTFGKALGCQGAAILGSKALIEYLVANSRAYIFSTSLAAINCVMALNAIGFLQSHPERVQQLQDNIRLFKSLCADAKVPLLDSDSAIQPIILGSSERTLAVAGKLASMGLIVGAIRPPTVPVNSGRLRVTLSACHTRQQLKFLVTHLTQCINGEQGKKLTVDQACDRSRES